MRERHICMRRVVKAASKHDTHVRSKLRSLPPSAAKATMRLCLRAAHARSTPSGHQMDTRSDCAKPLCVACGLLDQMPTRRTLFTTRFRNWKLTQQRGSTKLPSVSPESWRSRHDTFETRCDSRPCCISRVPSTPKTWQNEVAQPTLAKRPLLKSRTTCAFFGDLLGARPPTVANQNACDSWRAASAWRVATLNVTNWPEF